MSPSRRVGERHGDHGDSGGESESVDDSGEFQIRGAGAFAQFVEPLLIESAGREKRFVAEVAFLLEVVEESRRDSQSLQFVFVCHVIRPFKHFPFLEYKLPPMEKICNSMWYSIFHKRKIWKGGEHEKFI